MRNVFTKCYLCIVEGGYLTDAELRPPLARVLGPRTLVGEGPTVPPRVLPHLLRPCWEPPGLRNPSTIREEGVALPAAVGGSDPGELGL